MTREELVKSLDKKAVELSLDVVKMLGVGNVGHLGGSCSCAHIVAALYFYKMRVDPKNPKWEGRDRCLISKGHSVLAQYAALGELGFFDKSEFERLKCLDSMLQGHPDRSKTPGIEMNSGSLGQGLSVANGIGLSMRLWGRDNRTYVILGDGELQEGQVWEAAMAAANFKIDNVLAIVDNNGIQATGPIEARFNSYPIADKWRACRWNVIEIDGHNMTEIVDALDAAEKVKGQPTVIIARTVKGKNVSFAENNPAFHSNAMTKEQYELACSELSCMLKGLGD